MLRLRTAIEGALQRRWIGLVVVVLLAVLVVFVVVHDAEHALDDAAAVCLALVAAFTTLLASLAAKRLVPLPRDSRRGRDPPHLRHSFLFRSPRLNPVPLRL